MPASNWYTGKFPAYSGGGLLHLAIHRNGTLRHTYTQPGVEPRAERYWHVTTLQQSRENSALRTDAAIVLSFILQAAEHGWLLTCPHGRAIKP